MLYYPKIKLCFKFGGAMHMSRQNLQQCLYDLNANFDFFLPIDGNETLYHGTCHHCPIHCRTSNAKIVSIIS